MNHPDQRELLDHRYQDIVKIFAKLIAYGQKSGELYHEVNPVALAEHIVIFLEGLKLSSQITAIDEDFLTKQFDLLSKMIIAGR
jgi:hypothetical protein